MNIFACEDFIRKTLQEDIGFHDLTSEAIVPLSQHSIAEITAKQPGILAGVEVAAAVFRILDPAVEFTPARRDGDSLSPGDLIATVSGPTRSLLTGERTVLNYLQRLSGIASLTRTAVDRIKDYPCSILDTRKTTPGLRAMEKYAVRMGGGQNHRFGLFDAVMIKDNHIEAAGSIQAAVDMVRHNIGPMVKIEVETESLRQVQEALAAKVDVIMLDNMNPELMSEAVNFIAGRAITEASGGITLDSLETVAQTGVNYISLGFITHSARAVDISLNIVGPNLGQKGNV